MSGFFVLHEPESISANFLNTNNDFQSFFADSRLGELHLFTVVCRGGNGTFWTYTPIFKNDLLVGFRPVPVGATSFWTDPKGEKVFRSGNLLIPHKTNFAFRTGARQHPCKAMRLGLTSCQAIRRNPFYFGQIESLIHGGYAAKRIALRATILGC
ncbi:hypothetical protein TK45_15650 [Bowmanella sp. JS7-9]|nr:hypothetical protein TK45_15650 [Bowmanella sp. JS7-9]